MIGMENFARAISNVLKRYVQDGSETVDVSEIWVDTSLPKDLIIELIKSGGVEIPDGLKVIKNGRRTIWRRG